MTLLAYEGLKMFRAIRRAGNFFHAVYNKCFHFFAYAERPLQLSPKLRPFYSCIEVRETDRTMFCWVASMPDNGRTISAFFAFGRLDFGAITAFSTLSGAFCRLTDCSVRKCSEK